ncbi:MAG: hypothetical protein M1821_006424 [Bathelium mastoideum]|nr:MAG: hypothetical protein M1821_006424 [Bathelium mastoideum]
MLSGAFYAGVTAFLAVTAQAVSNISVPNAITAGTSTTINFPNANSTSYKVYLAATVPGYAEGLSCYLINSTIIPYSGITVNIPACVGPSAPNYYSIAVQAPCADPIYSAQFDFLGGNGTITDYERSLGGAPLWFAAQLPCTAYDCARRCAQQGYPADLSGDGAYANMTGCIKACPGVSGEPPSPCPPLAGNGTSAIPRSPPATGCPYANATAAARAASSTSSSLISPSSQPVSPVLRAGTGSAAKNVAAGVVAAMVASATTLASEIL